MRLYPHHIGESSVAAGADGVFAAVAIPGKSRLNHVWVDFSLISVNPQSVLSASLYGVTAYIVPVLDPDATVTPNAMWDLQIPKDDDVGSGVIDMDTSDTSDPTAEIEPGEPSLEEMFNVGSRPERVFERTEIISFAKQSAGFETGTPDTFIARDAWKAEISRAWNVDLPSVLMFGLSAPDTTGTGTSFFLPDSATDWLQLRFMADTAKDAWKQAVGLTEAGAETPYEEAAVLMSSYLEQFLEETAASWVGNEYRIFSDVRYDIDVEGELSIDAINAGA